jgi:hypothetical protein
METVKGKPGGPNRAGGEGRHIEDGCGKVAKRVAMDVIAL